MNNEDRVICARERVETEGVAGREVMERKTAALKQVAAVICADVDGGLHVSTRLYNACCIAGGRRCCYL